MTGVSLARTSRLGAITTILLFASGAGAAPKLSENQKSFSSPQEAADALVDAAEHFDTDALKKILGPEGEDLVSTKDPVQDKNNTASFAASAREKRTIEMETPKRAVIAVGQDAWPLPIPVVEHSGRWFFDSKAGHDEVLKRRIGANELDAIAVLRGLVTAEKKYAATPREGVHQYARRLISSPGKQDGLYWQNPDGSPGGPISEAVARAIKSGYTLEPGTPYHGYNFRLLTGQGPAATLGQLDYVVGDAMIGGFAFLAVPSDYGVTGVQSFIVAYDGVVYQKDLGRESAQVAEKIERYNPDKSWKRTDDDWGNEQTAATR